MGHQPAYALSIEPAAVVLQHQSQLSAGSRGNRQWIVCTIKASRLSYLYTALNTAKPRIHRMILKNKQTLKQRQARGRFAPTLHLAQRTVFKLLRFPLPPLHIL